MTVLHQTNLIITSVGSIETRSWGRLLGEDKLKKLLEIGCVGHLGGHFYDISGHEIEGKYKELHIGLSFEEIASNENVICVADTPKKAEAVYGALRGKLINSLIITAPLARRLLEVAQMNQL